MQLKNLLSLGSTAFKVILLRKGIPLIAGWRITNRCNYNCRYCGYWQRGSDAHELTTEQVLKIVDQLLSAGVRKIGFTGGEPLIRDDFGEILEYCADRDMSVGVNTNGSLVEKHLKKLNRLERMSLSIDGPKDINDSIRGKGAFDNVMRAIEIAREKNMGKIELVTVLSNVNVDSIEYLLDLAAGLKVRIIFQPATYIILGGNEKNPLALSDSGLKKAISLLLKAKSFNKYIGNSQAGLNYFLKYPKSPTAMRCARGLIAARINVDSTLYICDGCFNLKDQKYNRIIDIGFDKAWSELKPFICTTGCRCAKAVELNLALAGNIDAVLNGLLLY